MFASSSVFAVGVKVPTQVMSSFVVMVASEPAPQVTSSPLAKASTASENTIVRVVVSPLSKSLSPILTVVITGSTPSTM